MSGLAFKRNAEEAVDRRRKLLGGEMRDGILATLPVRVDTKDEWEAFEAKWQTYETGEARPFPSNEEIFERHIIGMSQRGHVDDDWLPVVYSTLDFGESLVGAQFGSELTCMYRPRGPGFSKAATVITDYADPPTVSDVSKTGNEDTTITFTQTDFTETGKIKAVPPCYPGKVLFRFPVGIFLDLPLAGLQDNLPYENAPLTASEVKAGLGILECHSERKRFGFLCHPFFYKSLRILLVRARYFVERFQRRKKILIIIKH